MFSVGAGLLDTVSEFDKSVTMRFTRVALPTVVKWLRIVGKYFWNQARHSAKRVAQCGAYYCPWGHEMGAITEARLALIMQRVSQHT